MYGADKCLRCGWGEAIHGLDRIDVCQDYIYDLEDLIELAKKLPPPTDEEREEQIISFAYGNLRLSGIDVTKEQLRAIMDKRKGNP